MKFNLAKGSIEKFKADIIAIGLFERVTDPRVTNRKQKTASLMKEDGGVDVDLALKGELSKLIAAEEFAGLEGAVKLIFTAGRIPARYVLLVGLGKKDEFQSETLRKSGALISKAASDIRAKTVALTFQKSAIKNLNISSRMQAMVEGFILGSYNFDKYKKEEDRKKITLETVFFISGVNQIQFAKAAVVGRALAEATILARDIGNTPSIDKIPSEIAKIADDIASKNRLKIDVLGVNEIRAEKMRALLAVAQGSANPPVFIHIKYKSQKKPKATVALVGKGVTFDSGGLSLKPPKHMDHMKDDVSGAAAVLGIMSVLPMLKPNLNVDAYIPVCENMPDGRAIRPGDIIKARNGKTIEIISTDAEGRLILADALSYACGETGRRSKPDYIIDIATLTGACAYAVGERYTAILGNDQRFIDKLKKCGLESGDLVWQLPLEKSYKKGMTKGIADLKNIGSSRADTINGALFLEEFVTDAKWVHLDIASTSWADETNTYTEKGSTGAGTRLLLNFLMSL